MEGFSALRLTGIVLGCVLLGMVFVRLRKHSEQRVDVWLLLLGGLGLIAVGAFPGLVNAPSRALSLNLLPGGRLLTLLLIMVLGVWMIVLRERSKRFALEGDVDALMQAQAVFGFVRDYPEVKVLGGVLVVMPAYNEADNLAVVLSQMPGKIAGKAVTVLVVDDGSTDGTGDVAAACGAYVVKVPVNRGGGSALRMGFAVAKTLKADVVVTMDADGQHRPAEIESLARPVIEGRAEIVVGSRVLGSCEVESRLRFAGVHVFSNLIRLLVGLQVTDCSSGFRAVRMHSLTRLTLLQNQYHTAEFLIEAAKKNLVYMECPICIDRRMSGKSKKGQDFFYGLRFLRTVILTWWR